MEWINKQKLINEQDEVIRTSKKLNPACNKCINSKVMCYGKTHRPGCFCCYQQKIGCSLAGGKRKWKMGVDETRMGVEMGGGMGGMDRLTEGVERMGELMEEWVQDQKGVREELKGIRMVLEGWMREEKESQRKKVKKGKKVETEKEREKEVEKEKEKEQEVEKGVEEEQENEVGDKEKEVVVVENKNETEGQIVGREEEVIKG